jgi:Domain of unknown function (DUF3883)
MVDIADLDLDDVVDSDIVGGAEAARLIWQDAEEANQIIDPRTPGFARAVIDELAASLATSAGIVKKMMKNATQGAADLNVSQFQGLVEIIQNADDLQATEVRFAFREKDGKRQLLIVHNGLPVTCHHVLGMALPYLTTKTHRVDQRGRFGIGLKTLNRIARSMAIHSSPYHFSGNQTALTRLEPEAALPGFYDPENDTLFVLDLAEGFDDVGLRNWFDAWEADGLLFLACVQRFRWSAIDGNMVAEKALTFGGWEDAQFVSRRSCISAVQQRRVRSSTQGWTVWKATVDVPKNLHRSHKARSDTTDISIAIPDRPARGRLYIGFKTLVPVGLTFSLDGQFDPSTTREAIIENLWNAWLIERCADVTADIATGLLAAEPTKAWELIPLADERVGEGEDKWLRDKFDGAFRRARAEIAESAKIFLKPDSVPLELIAYESVELAGFIAPAEIVALAPRCRALPIEVRDKAGRWRAVLNCFTVSAVIGTADLLDGFDQELFAAKDPAWWVEAADRLTKHHPQAGLFGRRFWLAEDRSALACQPRAATDRPLVFGEAPSAFAARWKLLDQLHEAYGTSGNGEAAITWLSKHAAFTSRVDAATELGAFAERFASHPIEIDDTDLRDLRDRFDELSDRNAEELGLKVGAALLLDGYTYKSGKQQKLKVSPLTSYLCRTIDSDHPNWPVAAADLQGIKWVVARYDEQLKSAATRSRRRRHDGTISRGPRKFLLLLGAEVAPRLQQTGAAMWGSAARIKELRATGAEQVTRDYVSPDLDRVLKHLQLASRKDAKTRSPALMRALSRNWDRLYKEKQTVPSEHVARVHTWPKRPVTAAWLNELHETEWVAVGQGERVRPAAAVIKSSETQTLYRTFAFDLQPGDVSPEIAKALHLITDVRVGDLIGYIETLRDSQDRVDEDHLLQVYRNIADRCPSTTSWNTSVGELNVQEVRRRFSQGSGLIHVGGSDWKRPDEVLRGKDIFHDRQRFVPGGPPQANLWLTLGVKMPDLRDCLAYCKALATGPTDIRANSALIDVYRYAEPLISSAEAPHRRRLRALPIVCRNDWVSDRPVFFIEDDELRNEIATALPEGRFWTPPCDTRNLVALVSAAGITRSSPALKVTSDRISAMGRGETDRVRFGLAVDHLSDELARNDPSTRDKLRIGWDGLKAIPLFIYDDAISVEVNDIQLSATPLAVRLNAIVDPSLVELHVSQEMLGDREYGGRAIASLFPTEVRRKIGAEWALAWQKSLGSRPDSIRLASDEEHLEALQRQAGKISAAPKIKIRITSPASRSAAPPPRTLKQMVGQITGVSVRPGSPLVLPIKTGSPATLASAPPEPKLPSLVVSQTAPIAYSNTDLEQRGWEFLEPVLNTSPEELLVDFRNRHGIGADGVINWKTFVELKATGRDPQSSIELSNAEYERAKERGMDFILALVSGLETDQKAQVRLIFDPANRVSSRPVNGIRLTGLLDAPCIVINFEDPDAI